MPQQVPSQIAAAECFRILGWIPREGYVVNIGEINVTGAQTVEKTVDWRQPGRVFPADKTLLLGGRYQLTVLHEARC
jgi:hypothetical protein